MCVCVATRGGRESRASSPSRQVAGDARPRLHLAVFHDLVVRVIQAAPALEFPDGSTTDNNRRSVIRGNHCTKYGSLSVRDGHGEHEASPCW